MLARILELEGYSILKAENAARARQIFAHHQVHVALTDIKLPDGNGLELLEGFKAEKPEVEVICLTAHGKIQDGVKAIQLGAFDYLVKGDDNKKIIPLVAKAVEKAHLQLKLARLQQRIQSGFGFQNIIGRSEALKMAIDMARKVAETDTTVLLTGATGTGKEVFAKAIHAGSKRASENFLAINCSALGKDILESELFGHKAGAFTGAAKDKSGLFEEAHRGTIFLDEIGEMDVQLQAKILRVLQDGSFIRLGDTSETKVDVRIIAATNRELSKEVETGGFREDLFYRLSVFNIHLPSLNERKEDIPVLTASFIAEIAAKTGKKISGNTPKFLEALMQHNWKGNIRELRNIIERAVILADTPELTPDLLPFDFLLNQQPGISTGVFRLKDLEKEHIKNLLAHTGGNKTKAAELLDISLGTLYNKIKEYGL